MTIQEWTIIFNFSIAFNKINILQFRYTFFITLAYIKSLGNNASSIVTVKQYIVELFGLMHSNKINELHSAISFLYSTRLKAYNYQVRKVCHQ